MASQSLNCVLTRVITIVSVIYYKDESLVSAVLIDSVLIMVGKIFNFS